MKASGTGRGALVRDVLLVALSSILTFELLRNFVADRYLVPTDSMQPTLYGDPARGDHVLVDKLSRSSGLRVHDLVVIRRSESPVRLLVKRVAALGDDIDRCYVALRDGDLWSGPDAQHLARDRKHPLEDRDLRVTWIEFPPPSGPPTVEGFLRPARSFEGGSRLSGILATDQEILDAIAADRRARALPPGTLPDGWQGTASSVDTSFLDARGVRRGPEGMAVTDCGAEIELEDPVDIEGFALCLELSLDQYCWIVRDAVRFYRNGQPIGEPIPAGQLPTRVEFGFLDGSFFLILGDLLVDWRPRPSSWVSPALPEAKPRPRNALAWRVLGRGSAALRRVRIFRDLWYGIERAYDREQVSYVPPGMAYLLGDNSFDSDDSRLHGPFSLADYVGRPRLVLGPYPRWKWLSR
ncbi:MAG: hypothetical protein Fur0037_16000 [Planctomycetota bacterium]